MDIILGRVGHCFAWHVQVPSFCNLFIFIISNKGNIFVMTSHCYCLLHMTPPNAIFGHFSIISVFFINLKEWAVALHARVLNPLWTVLYHVQDLF